MSQSDKNSNHELRKQLKAFMSQAQTNEAKLEKMQQQELRFISSNSLPELIDVILQQYRDAYELDYVRVYTREANIKDSLLTLFKDYVINFLLGFLSNFLNTRRMNTPV